MTIPQTPHATMHLKGRYRVQRIKAESGQVVQSSAWMNNLITDAGKQVYINSNKNIHLSCSVGSGNSPPAASNTALDHELHRKYAEEVIGTPPVFTENGGTLTSTYRFRFDPGQATGNISELGIYLGLPGNSNFTLFSRALVRDSNHNPTTITVLSDEYLDVYWAFTLEVAGRSAGTFPFYEKDGTTSTLDWVLKPAATHWWRTNAGSNMFLLPQIHKDGYYSYLFDNIGSEPSRNEETPAVANNWDRPNTGLALPYSDGNYYRDYEYVWLLDRANFNNINCFRLNIGVGHLWLYLPNAGIDKTAMDKLTVRFRLMVA